MNEPYNVDPKDLKDKKAGEVAAFAKTEFGLVFPNWKIDVSTPQ